MKNKQKPVVLDACTCMVSLCSPAAVYTFLAECKLLVFILLFSLNKKAIGDVRMLLLNSGMQYQNLCHRILI